MTEDAKTTNFLEQIIQKDLDSGKVTQVVTRFPPEPNGFLHIGHAFSLCLNFGLAKQFGGQCNLRFDDTNPEKEEQVFVDSIQADVRWLDVGWNGEVFYASSYFDQLHEWAVHLVKAGHAYVCDLSPDQAREYRGTLTEPGKNSPYRDRSIEENVELLEKMRQGDFDEGACVLRAKIDMTSPNINLRDPILYRIRKQTHHQTGDKWCIYPSYDFAHGQEDAIEGVTHSICTLEFADHKPLYNWLLEKLPVPAQPNQYEFARVDVSYMITSKRKLQQLVLENYVDGWDDPRMPTVSGMRRRGFTPASIRNFCQMVGVPKSGGIVDISMLEFAVRDDLNHNAPRAMCVLNPLKVTFTNYGAATGLEDEALFVSQPVHPQKEELGERRIPFSQTVYIDRADFSEDTTLSRKRFKRLVLGEWVRLRGAYVVKADAVIHDENGYAIEILASIVPNTVGVNPPDGIRPRGVIHWVSAEHAVDCEVRVYDRLFQDPAPGAKGKDFLSDLNPDSLAIIEGCKAEPSLSDAPAGLAYQFEREGYFCLDSKHSEAGKLVFNRTIALKDTWEKKVK